MKVLLDTCVIIDFLQGREPFAETSKKIFEYIAVDYFRGYITSKSATDIYYLMHRFTHSDKKSRDGLNQLLDLVELLDTSAKDIFQALSSQISDFEDAVMVETALRSKMDCIVTRNKKDYKKSRALVYTPDEFLNKIESIDIGRLDDETNQIKREY